MDWWDEMACKTVAKHHAKMLPMSVEARTALTRDDDDNVKSCRCCTDRAGHPKNARAWLSSLMPCRLPRKARLPNQSAGGRAKSTKRLTSPPMSWPSLRKAMRVRCPLANRLRAWNQQQTVSMTGRPVAAARDRTRITRKASRMPAPVTPRASTAKSKKIRCASANGSAATPAQRQRDAMIKHSLRMQIQEVEREIRNRRMEYPREIARGHMRNGEAVELIEMMESVLATLQELQAQEQRK